MTREEVTEEEGEEEVEETRNKNRKTIIKR